MLRNNDHLQIVDLSKNMIDVIWISTKKHRCTDWTTCTAVVFAYKRAFCFFIGFGGKILAKLYMSKGISIWRRLPDTKAACIISYFQQRGNACRCTGCSIRNRCRPAWIFHMNIQLLCHKINCRENCQIRIPLAELGTTIPRM